MANGRVLQVRDINLVVTDAGAGQAVVFVHGFPLNRSIWDEQVAVVSRRWRAVAPDLRGFGQSGVTPGTVTMDQLADDLAAMLDVMDIVEPVVMVGLSMGGYVSFEFLARHRDRLRALVLVDTRSVADTPDAASGRLEAAGRVEREGPSVLAELMLPRMFSPTTYQQRPQAVEQLRAMIAGGSALGLAAAARGLAQRPDFTPLLPRIGCPVLVVVGRHDAISTPAEMAAIARAIPGAKLVEVDHAGHMTPLEQPAELNAALLEFLAAL